jgi:hypothetical protein
MADTSIFPSIYIFVCLRTNTRMLRVTKNAQPSLHKVYLHHMIKLFMNIRIVKRCFRVRTSCRLRWVHTCYVTAYRNAVTLQVTDTIRSNDLNFHPVPNGVTVFCERYTLGFPVCYTSQKHHECK